ncbi:MAG: tRNA pseudouridine(55) synthase TruB [Anaerovoracaceae bacterium]
MNGIINFLKPAGMTSHDCVYFLRKITGIKRIGHTGTLDPMAAGVLPLCIGNATRIMDYLDLDHKVYRCQMILGIVTDTWDIWGNVLEDKREKFEKPDIVTIEKVFQSFTGEIFQTPPSYSSVRIGGKHLYEYAREGKRMEAAKRPAIIHELRIIAYDRAAGRITFDIRCSKGTYVRSVCHEAGNLLGTGGAMSFLLRTASGEFQLEESAPPERLKEDWQNYLLPMDYPLTRFGKINIREDRAAWFGNGGYLRAAEAEVLRLPMVENLTQHIRIREGMDRAYCVYSGKRFLGVALYDTKKRIYTADKVLCR